MDKGECFVSFDMGGHGTAPERQIVTIDECAEEPEAPTAEGYVFDGWFKDETFTEPFDFAAPIKGSTTIYAKWIQLYSLKVRSAWQNTEGSQPIEVGYLVQYSERTSASGTLTLSMDNGWTQSIPVSEDCAVTLTEAASEDVAFLNWRLENWIDDTSIGLSSKPSVTFNLGKLSQDMSTALKRGKLSAVATNGKPRVYSVEKNWVIEQSQYMPQELSVVLQHLEDGKWYGVRTLTLSAENGWKGSFDAVVDDGKGWFDEYRIRERDRYGNVVLDSTDEGGAEEPLAVLTAHPYAGTEVDVTYKVSYANDEAAPTTKITNTAGTKYYVTMAWEGLSDAANKPQEVKVTLAMDGVNKDWILLNEANNWTGAFEEQAIVGDSVVRESDSNGWVYMEGDTIPSSATNKRYNKAVFEIVAEDGTTRQVEYDVSISYDEATRLTTITNTEYGLIHTVERRWLVGEDSVWRDWIKSERFAYAQLQHRIVDASGAVTWEDVGDAVRIDPESTYGSKVELPAIPAGEEANYRVREKVQNSTKFSTYVDTVKYVPGGEEGAWSKLLAAYDEDNPQGTAPVFMVAHRYWDSDLSSYVTEQAAFRTVYRLNEEGDYSIDAVLTDADVTQSAGVLEQFVGWQEGAPSVWYDGKEWTVVGYEATGTEGTVTLLGKDAGPDGQQTLVLDIGSVILTSAAKGGKNSGTSDNFADLASALMPVGINGEGSWKLTLKDARFDGFEVSIPSNNTAAQSSFVYKGAVPGDNSYISAIVVNGNGDVVYYGRLFRVTEELGGENEVTVTLDLEGLALDDCAIWVFNEECNGDFETDFASSAFVIYIEGAGGEGQNGGEQKTPESGSEQAKDAAEPSKAKTTVPNTGDASASAAAALAMAGTAALAACVALTRKRSLRR